jgi:hypothetical protein
MANTCQDQFSVCTSSSGLCGTGSIISDIPINEACPTTCGVCEQIPVNCSTSGNDLCKNGATCVDTSINNIIGFNCNCPVGYSGTLCEKSNNFRFL